MRCLARAAFSTGTGDMCGEIWLLSADPELMDSCGTDASLPNVFSAQTSKSRSASLPQRKVSAIACL